ncbi:hypothetical protein C0J52_18802 [Blattella germanica]|nr:hypothetical protein C0J52_18802 [Blattella germanica]
MLQINEDSKEFELETKCAVKLREVKEERIEIPGLKIEEEDKKPLTLLKQQPQSKEVEELTLTNNIDHIEDTNLGIEQVRIDYNVSSRNENFKFVVQKDNLKSCRGNSIISCEICAKTFTSEYDLAEHKFNNVHCKICGNHFPNKRDLSEHLLTHKSDGKFQCVVCSKTFIYVSELKSHMRAHTGERPFVCSICSKAYSRRCHLNVHLRIHTGEHLSFGAIALRYISELIPRNDHFHVQSANNLS